MDKFKEILETPIVLGLVRNGNKLLVSKGYDKLKEQGILSMLGWWNRIFREKRRCIKEGNLKKNST